MGSYAAHKAQQAEELEARVRELEAENALLRAENEQKSQHMRDIWSGYRQRGEQLRRLQDAIDEPGGS